MMVSSMSTITREGAEVTGVREANATRNREATASSCRTWPKVKARRNDPRVEGA
jgi:hypothetical protein